MKRFLLLAALFVSIFRTASAQLPGNEPVIFVSTAPAGSCANGSAMQIVVTTGAVYTCAAGTWTELGSSATDGFPITIGTTSIAGGSDTTTIAGLTLTAPTFTAPVLGTPASGVVTNLTGTGAFNTTGTAANLSGTPALPNGTTGTTQLGSDSSTKLATTAQVQAAIAAAAPVTAVSVATANGVSGSSSGGTTPALTITLGAITPTSTNGVSAATLAFMDATSSVQTQLNGKQAGLSIPTGTATFSAGTGITSVGCAAGYLCNNTRGTLTIVAAVGATTGTIATVNFSGTLSGAPACFAYENGGSTNFGIGNSAPTSSSFNITAGISVSLATLTVNYTCQP